MINRGISKLLCGQGHGDMIMIADAGFAIPKGIEVIDISLSENKPMVLEVAAELKKYFSVEKLIIAFETKNRNPGFFSAISSAFGHNMEVEMVEHKMLQEICQRKVTGVIRTGDFTAYGNVILVSGAGGRWYCEK